MDKKLQKSLNRLRKATGQGPGTLYTCVCDRPEEDDRYWTAYKKDCTTPRLWNGVPGVIFVWEESIDGEKCEQCASNSCMLLGKCSHPDNSPDAWGPSWTYRMTIPCKISRKP